MKRRGPEDPPDEEPPLFANTGPKARNTDPWTSHAAGDSSESFSAQQQRVIYHILLKNPRGLIVHDIARIHGEMQAVQVSRRMIDLVRSGLVRDTGRVGLSPSNRKAIIWEAV